MELWILVCSFIGALAGTSLSAYVTGRFSEKGKLDSAIANLDKLSKQVEVVTEKAETIKTQLGAGEWNRQWARDRRREVYADIVQNAYQVLSHLNVLQAFTAAMEAGDPGAFERAQQFFDEIEPLSWKLRQAQAVASLFASFAAQQALEAMMTAFAGPHGTPSERFTRTQTRFISGLIRFVAAARLDLGMEPSELPNDLQLGTVRG